jgi:hypothetical protein
VVRFDRLSAAEQVVLKGLRDDPQWYGILRPRNDSRLTIKSVTTDVAFLLLTLRTAARLPQSVVDLFGDQCDSLIGKMVLDEILQVEVNGEMLCGPAAIDVVAGESKSVDSERFIATLSRRALQYAEWLDSASVLETSRSLYCYNRAPASSRWRHVLCDCGAVESYLGINRGRLAEVVDADWVRVTGPSAAGWIAWQSKRLVPKLIPRTYKLYVSPTCAAVGSVLGSVVEAASRFGASHWKIGNDVHGLLRPDKLILYFERFTDLRDAAAYLIEKLDGCPSQGVPFTAELEARGLLSWGADPPTEKGPVPWLERESWRGRICNGLASALLVAKRAQRSNRISPSRFAKLRLRLDGIDTDTWTPAL